VDSVLCDTKTQKMQFTCCGYTYGTRFGHNLTVPPGKLKPVPEWRLKKQNNAKLAVLAYLKRAQHDQPER
jgi:hypothetical protein